MRLESPNRRWRTILLLLMLLVNARLEFISCLWAAASIRCRLWFYVRLVRRLLVVGFSVWCRIGWGRRVMLVMACILRSRNRLLACGLIFYSVLIGSGRRNVSIDLVGTTRILLGPVRVSVIPVMNPPGVLLIE